MKITNRNISIIHILLTFKTYKFSLTTLKNKINKK
jgi:hypothetical protein